MGPEPLQRLVVGVAERALGVDGDHSDLRLDALEKSVAAGAPAAVVGDLKHGARDGFIAVNEILLGQLEDVARQQERDLSTVGNLP